MITIGLVEDNPTVRQSLQELIEATPGMRCVCACETGKEALTVIPKIRPEVVLMDLHLPGESGAACTARLKEKMPQLHVLILTVYKDPEKIFAALKAGASGYLLKRAKPEKLVEAIKEVYSGGAPMSSEIARFVVQSFRAAPPAEAVQESSLSPRESEILGLLSEGLTNREIGSRLGISPETARTHLGHIYEKLHVRGRTEAVSKFLKSGGEG
jgi:DNA-binding NarL/FixJ family response regulator